MIKEFSKRERESAIESISDWLGLHSFLDQTAGTLSGGQKRRLSLAMSLVGNTRLIFLDEPTSGLDPLSRDDLWRLIRQLKEQGKTLLLTTHYLEEADCLADNVLILSNGKHYMEGTPDEIKKQLCGGYTLTIFGFQKDEAGILTKQVSELMESFEIKEKKEFFGNLKFTLPFSKQIQFSKLFFELENLQSHFSFQVFSFIQFSLEMHTLEDAFLQIGLDTQPLEALDTEFSITQMPNPKFSLFSQVSALFLRKFYVSFRKMSSLFMMFLPIVYILIGSFVQTFLFKIADDDKNKQVDLRAKTDFNTLAIFIIQGYCFKSSIFLNLPVLEKETKIKHLLIVSGCRRFCYWLGNFIFDFFIFVFGVSVFFLSMILMLKILFRKQTVLLNHIAYLTKCLLPFGVSLILYSFVCSKFFAKATSAYKIFPVLNFFVAYLVPNIISQVFSFKENLKDKLVYVEIVSLTFSPFFVLDKLLAKLSYFETTFFESENVYLLFFLLQIVSCLFLLYFFESVKSPESFQSSDQKFFEVRNLSKKYSSTSTNAVEGVSFALEKGDVMGILGPNGAGKSTTFNSILGVIARDKGDFFLEKQKIDSLMQIHSLFNSLVLQEDCLWPQMTSEEHLQFYFGMKGIDAENSLIFSVLKEFGLLGYISKQAEKLSGGNKRKLSLALASLVIPDLIIFDEPTNGIDVFIKKRFYSRILSLKESAILLTTHSLSECEILCNKIAILFKGKIVEYGDLNAVKKKFSESVKVTLKAKNEKDLRNWVSERYLGRKSLQTESETYFSLSFSSEEKFSQICCELDELINRGLISDFSISQSTLQQVFVKICKEQEEIVTSVN